MPYEQKKDAPSASNSQFNCARAMFRSIKRQKFGAVEPDNAGKKEPEAEEKEIVSQPEQDDNEELRRKAVNKLKQEAARGAQRAETMGPQGW